MWPSAYWHLWLDCIIDKIPLRVLEHIRAEAKAARAINAEFLAQQQPSSRGSPNTSLSNLRLCGQLRRGVTCTRADHAMQRTFLTSVFALLAAVSGCGGGSVSIPPPSQPSDPDQRADLLVAQMTQDEKIQLVAGSGTPGSYNLNFPRDAGGYIPGIPRLGIPDLIFCRRQPGRCRS